MARTATRVNGPAPRDGRGWVGYSRAPQSTDGRVGDLYVNFDTMEVFGPRTSAGAWPLKGTMKGPNGWSPVLATIADGVRRVHRVVDWAGGAGPKPAVGSYVGASGFVSDIASASNVRGADGPAMVISALTPRAATLSYNALAPVADAGGDNGAVAIKDLFAVGGQMPFASVEEASSVALSARVGAVVVRDASYLLGGPMHVRRRVWGEPVGVAKHRSLDRLLPDGTEDSANGGWWAADTASTAYFCSPAEGRVGSDDARAWAAISVPTIMGKFIDNVLCLQNRTIGGTSGDLAGNAAISFLDSAGTERSAVGYSRNGLITTNGYHPDLLYAEIGNPFTVDEAFSNFAVVITVKAGSAHWGGAAKSYFPLHINSKTGVITFSGSSGGSADQIRFSDGGIPAQVTYEGTDSRLRIRETVSAGHFALSTNDYALGTPSDIGQDNVSLPSWRLAFGGAADDYFEVARAPAGATAKSQYVSALRVDNGANVLVGLTGRSAYADGQLAVDSLNDYKAAITARGGGIAGAPVVILWSKAVSGDNALIWFGTDATWNQRGSITYNRGSAVVAYNTTSDYRSKSVVGAITDALSRVMAVEPHRVRMHGATQDIDAFVAHELSASAPYAVSGDKDAVSSDGNPIYQQVNLGGVAPLLWAALRELNTKVDAFITSNT